jgi:hypothetical protein
LDKLLHTDATIRRQLAAGFKDPLFRISSPCMIGRRGVAFESREQRAARIVANLATSINMTHFPGAAQCICSLLETSSCKQYFREPQRVTASEDRPQERRFPDCKEDQRHGNGAHIVHIKDQI